MCTSTQKRGNMFIKAIINTCTASVFKTPNSLTLEDEILYGQPVHIISETNKRYLVETEYGYTGYCLKKCTITNERLVNQYNNCPKQIVKSAFIDILKKPQIDSSILKTAPFGAKLAICDEQNSLIWKKVLLADGKTGYCKAQQLYTIENNCLSKETQIRKAICNNAKRFLGVPYRWGGKTFAGIDCSGLASLLYYIEGITVYRDAKIVDGFAAKQIPVEQIKNGDLLYFPGHIAVYLGNGKFIHSTNHKSGCGVCIASLNDEDKNFRHDLKSTLYAAASVFSNINI